MGWIFVLSYWFSLYSFFIQPCSSCFTHSSICIHAFMHPSLYILNYSFTHLSTHHQDIHWPTQLSSIFVSMDACIHVSIHKSVYSPCIHASIPLSIHSMHLFIHLPIAPFIYPFIYPSTHPQMHACTHSLAYVIHPCIHSWHTHLLPPVYPTSLQHPSIPGTIIDAEKQIGELDKAPAFKSILAYLQVPEKSKNVRELRGTHKRKFLESK